MTRKHDVNDENYNVLCTLDDMKHVKNPTFQDIESIVSDHSAAVFVWGDNETLVDAFTASGLIAVYNALSPDNQAKFNRMAGASQIQFMKLVNFMWKSVK